MRNPDPPLRTPLSHTCHNAPACFYVLTSSPPAHAFPGSEHKRKKNIRFEGNKTIASVCVCVRMHWREREGYTHTLVKGIWRSHFFFLSFTSERYNQILPYSYDLFFFWWRKHIIFSYSHQTNNTASNFLNVFFFLLHAHTLYTNKIDVAIKKKALSLTHTRTRSFSRIHSVCPVPCNEGIRPPYARTCCTVARHCNVEADDTPG